MDSNITNEKLILYLYNETDMLDSVLVQRQIDEDPETECAFENIKASLKLFDAALTPPSQESVNRILRYAAQNLS
ncbi:MAG: hypothetical protein ACO3O0_09710 [Bacteroidia bacterium]|jgi:hypothetical protein